MMTFQNDVEMTNGLIDANMITADDWAEVNALRDKDDSFSWDSVETSIDEWEAYPETVPSPYCHTESPAVSSDNATTFESLLIGEWFLYDGIAYEKQSGMMARSADGQWIADNCFNDAHAPSEQVERILG